MKNNPMIKSYRLKPQPVVNLQGAAVTIQNAEAIANWCGGEVQSDGTGIVGVLVPTITGVKTAELGDFVYRNDDNGRITVMPAYDFLNGYEEVAAEPIDRSSASA